MQDPVMSRVPPAARTRLADNLRRLRERITAAAEAARRSPDSVRLVAVTKTVPLEVAFELPGLGVLDLGENRPEELRRKALAADAAGLPIRWHMIGHYQRRKIRDSLAHVALVHAVHDIGLAQAIERRAEALDRIVPILLQVNVSGEGSKQGLAPDRVPEALRATQSLPHLRTLGLMTMAPFGADPEALTGLFGELAAIRDRLATPATPLGELSMGMSGDFEAAISAGATLIRVGSALFEGVM